MKDFPDLSNFERSEPFLVQDVSPSNPDAGYRALKRVSNSDFDLIPYLLKGTSKPERNDFANQALTFGSAFHAGVLQPEKFSRQHFQGINWLLLDRLIQSCQASERLQKYLELSMKEVEHTFEMQGLPCKCKIDMVFLGIEGILDLKTTSQETYEGFAKTVKAYNYDRQMAFYADSVGAKQAILIGVSKKTFELFFYSLTDADFESGRAKYNKALSQIKEHNLLEQIFENR